MEFGGVNVVFVLPLFHEPGEVLPYRVDVAVVVLDFHEGKIDLKP